MKHGDGSLMVSGCVSYKLPENGNLDRTYSKTNAALYRKILEENFQSSNPKAGHGAHLDISKFHLPLVTTG